MRPEDQLIGALIGLVRVCNHKQRTSASDEQILESFVLLRTAGQSAEKDPEVRDSLQQMTQRIHAEKHRISPGCEICQSPCGGTTDYDMEQFRQESNVHVRSMKTLLLLSAEEIAIRLHQNRIAPSQTESCLLYLYRSLMAIGDDNELEDLLLLLMEVGPLLQ